MEKRKFARIVAAVVAAALIAAPASTAAAPAGAPHSAAQDAAFARDLDQLIASAMHRFPTVPALAIAVVRSRGPIALRAFGMADREARRRADLHTRFYIASSTKSFVALAMAALARRGAIDLDWTLAGLAPDMSFAPEVQADKVTLRRLLSHTHGLSENALQFRLAYSGDYDSAALWRLVGRVKPNPKAPLGSFAYSNLGYNIAALLIERKLGRSWQELVEREVIAPLGLRDTAARGLARHRRERAAPYDGLSRLYLVKTDATMQSAGGMESSAADMARWVRLQLAAERGAPAPIAPAAVVDTHRPVATLQASFGPFARAGYGLGWYSGPFDGALLYHAFGGFTGARAHVSFMPEADLGVAALTNDEGAGDRLVDVAAAYAYDWYRTGRAAAARAAEERLAGLERDEAGAAAKTAADAAARLRPDARLSRPLAAYAGRYCSDEWGRIDIAAGGGGLAVRMGRLHAAAAPAEGEAATAELIPGQRVRIAFAGAPAVTSLTVFGSSFSRCGG